MLESKVNAQTEVNAKVRMLCSNSITIKVLELRLILVDIRVSIQLSNSNSRL